MKKNILVCLLSLFLAGSLAASPQYSVAGLFPVEGTQRAVFNFNVGWRFHLGEVEGSHETAFDDSLWEVISVPHTPALIPTEGSGGRNYQGKAWYRKHFTIDPILEGKRVVLYFEAVMGRTEIYVNGQKAVEQSGGYLPFSVVLTDYGVRAGEPCVVAVMTDNSDNKDYPPGKPQHLLDFAYHGGIYRDVWMIATPTIYLTDPNLADKPAGGGVFVRYGEVNDRSAEVFVRTDVMNGSDTRRKLKIHTDLVDSRGEVKGRATKEITLRAGESGTVEDRIVLSDPELWTPETPHLYRVETRIADSAGEILDGGATRIGIRTVEFRGAEGFWLNGKKYERQLIGTNRHQDFAYVGNALPNSQQRRDALKIRQAGFNIVRSAHYPMDPAFMDACDEFGIFVIVATPGWQFWNSDPQFGEYVFNDIRQMIRRDRNHPSVLLWEPILNETRFPKDFTRRAWETVREEYPYPGAYMAGDHHSQGVAELFDVVYGWPEDESKGFRQSIFTREFSDNVDDWYAHNANNRAARAWGEHHQLVQAAHLSEVYGTMRHTTGQFIGGAQWHSFDHQRGYHPDPYWGGIWDAFRQPKYAFQMFRSQMEPDYAHPAIETGPMVFIAHEIGPFSHPDVVVYSNCDSVRLTVYEGRQITLPVVREEKGGATLPLVFHGVYDFNEMRRLPYREKAWEKVSFLAEGIIDGQVVCSTKKMPSRRSTKLRLSLDHIDGELTADGSDFCVVIAEVTDDEGNVRRLAEDRILYTAEGEGEIIGDATVGANPRRVEFGSAPV